MNKNGVNWDAELEYIKQVDAKAPTESKALCQCDRDWTDGGRLCQECGLERPATESKAEGGRDEDFLCECGHPVSMHRTPNSKDWHECRESRCECIGFLVATEPPQPSVQGEQDDNNTDAHLSCRRIVAELMDRVTELEKSAPSITSARIAEIAKELFPTLPYSQAKCIDGIEKALREAGVKVER